MGTFRRRAISKVWTVTKGLKRRLCDVLTHKVVHETLASAPVHQYHALRIHVGDVHGGALHLGISETHLHVNVVYILQEVREIPPSCFNRQIITETVFMDK